uniref:C2H2-type domain-containing protein n=1 Tax=Esox lucius TaxID=8010 RepID=A0AAY5KWW5_ESOLU
MRDVLVFPIASPIDFSNGGVTSTGINTCQLCDKSFSSHEQVQEKMPTEAVKGNINNAKPWKCCVCKATFGTHGRLRFHRQKHVSGLNCPVCGKCFQIKHHLDVHMKIHSVERPFSCEECGKTYRTAGLRNAHMSIIHSTKRDMFCPECGKPFKLKTQLDIHMNMHTGNRPYQCTDCEASFKTPSALSSHKTIHTGEKPFSCPQCGKRFRLNGNLTNHLSTHSAGKGRVKKSGENQSKGKKKQSDTEEDSDSIRLQHLKHHQRIHTGEKPCSCPFCNRTFKEPAALRKHVLIICILTWNGVICNHVQRPFFDNVTTVNLLLLMPPPW